MRNRRGCFAAAWACSRTKIYTKPRSQGGMRNDANLLARSPRGGRGSFFPSSLRAISTYLRSVSANASNIASTVRSAAVSPVSTGSLHEDDRQREQVLLPHRTISIMSIARFLSCS